MTYLTVTQVAPAQISGTLSTDDNSFSIPLKIAGTGMAHFRTSNRDGKLLELSPDLIHVWKNGALQFSKTEIRVTKMFGKNSWKESTRRIGIPLWSLIYQKLNKCGQTVTADSAMCGTLKFRRGQVLALRRRKVSVPCATHLGVLRFFANVLRSAA
jgi:hypothetical protein